MPATDPGSFNQTMIGSTGMIFHRAYILYSLIAETCFGRGCIYGLISKLSALFSKVGKS